MKIRLLILSILVCGGLSAQTLNNTIYLRAPQYLFPTDQFGYTKQAADTIQTGSLEKYGFGIGLGGIMYFDSDTASEFATFGIDFTFAELNLLFNDVIGHDFAQTGSTYEVNSVLYSIKMGPIISLRPSKNVIIDIFAQGQFTMGVIEPYFADENFISSNSFDTHVRANAGVNIGYDKYYFSFEYNYGQPSIKKVVETQNQNIIQKKDIIHSYFKASLVMKFNPF